jgi:hypothetical protein
MAPPKAVGSGAAAAAPMIWTSTGASLAGVVVGVGDSMSSLGVRD